MNQFLRSISIIFHPLIMPLLGVIFYFSKTPRFIPSEIIQAKILSTIILTIILPILIYFLLRTLGKAHSIYLRTVEERILPLGLNSIVIYLILKRVFTSGEIIELYFFFVGILLSNLACFILALLKFKASIHMIAISGFLMFCIALSIRYSININGTLALLIIITGAIASSRIHLKAHDNKELLVGLGVGFVPQLLLMNFWLN